MPGIEVAQLTVDSVWVAALVLGLMQAIKQVGGLNEAGKAALALLLGQYFSAAHWLITGPLVLDPLFFQMGFYAHLRGLVGSLAAMGIWAMVLKQVVEGQQPSEEE